MTGISSLASRTERESARALERALARLAEHTGSSLFIDSSKDPSEFLRLTLLPSRIIVPVHLIRDPRAVAWSGFRRIGTNPLAIARHWARLNRAIAWLRLLTRRYPWQTIRYEDLCADPEPLTRKLLAAAGSAADVGQTKANHALGGSSGFSIESSHAIVLDERWKTEMPEVLQRQIMLGIGRTARQFGYS